jgi:hypothetical protein
MDLDSDEAECKASSMEDEEQVNPCPPSPGSTGAQASSSQHL